VRFLILSDMHGNAEAFSAVLRRVRRKRFGQILVLGDLVGYGAAPNQVVDAVRALPGRVAAVRGNHDKVAAGLDPGANFNRAALLAARWTAQRLTPINLRYVRDLPQGPLEVADGVWICHGSPLDEDAYLFSTADVADIFDEHPGAVTFFGHTHLPSVFMRCGREIRVSLLRGEEGTLELLEDCQYLLNPGSIGQPRDRDPRASYMTYDSRKRLVHWHRVPYAVERAQQRIVKAGLPKVLADRLAAGA
jgi:predicted phosphodiesterase